MEHKVQTVADIKVLDEGMGGFVGYASTWDNWDAVNEKPVRGAFGKSLSDFVQNGFVAIGHDWSSLPIATVKSAIEDDHGLLIDVEFHGTTPAQEARQVMTERLARGKGAKLSIGYEVLKSHYVDEPQGGRLLEELKLYEVSFVTVPANDQASVLAAKADLHAGSSLADHAEAVLAAAQELQARFKSIHALLAKEGRPLSEARRARLTAQRETLAALLADIDDMLASTAPKPKDAEKDALNILALKMQFERIEAQLRGDLPWVS